MNPKVDEFLSKADKWQKELEALRRIVLACGLTEELKWRVPCYTYQNANIVVMQGLKDYCAFGFFKGVLLSDPNSILDKPGVNTQSARLVRVTSVKEIKRLEPVLKAYIYEAIEVEKAGLKVPFKKTAESHVPEEFQKMMAKNAALKKAFQVLTPGRQRGWLLYFSAPKQSTTRVSRIENSIPRILKGKGIHDRD